MTAAHVLVIPVSQPDAHPLRLISQRVALDASPGSSPMLEAAQPFVIGRTCWMALNDRPSPVSSSSYPTQSHRIPRLIGRTIALGLVKGMATAVGGVIVSSIAWWFGHR